MRGNTIAEDSNGCQEDFDLVLVGGGLANCLIAWRLIARRPELRICVVERGWSLGGNHTWSFHSGDVAPGALVELAPFLVASWARQSVRFPQHGRVFEVGYHAVSSERLHEVLAPMLGERLRVGAEVAQLEPDRVVLSGQRVLTARCVIDGRGPDPETPLALGFQKFLGLEIETVEPHGERVPVIMDATVAQLDGYRFVYTLPFSQTRMLIEDTYYTDGAALDEAVLRERIIAYAAGKGWTIARVVREESGVLPVVLAGDMDAFWRCGEAGVARSGLRAALFHPTTGYSLPDALAFADRLAGLADLSAASVRAEVEAHARALWKERAFFRLLNRMMFIAAEPAERVLILERFYRLPAGVVGRFFAAKLTLGDKAQIIAIMAAKPPLPLGKALGVFGEGAAWAFAQRAGR
ncbi:MAG: lycopene beta-cyclase CrtY [Hyphomicrobiaceae bacterium]